MNKEQLVDQLSKNIHNCKKCRLYQHAKNPVPGEGNINSKLIFIGEAPGRTEDETGRPFVGRAGVLLTNLLKRIGYAREDIWIGNIIKHRPPENRDPLPDEIEACVPYLRMQLELIDPWLIVTLGRFSMNFFYPEGKISLNHGTLIKSGKFHIYPVYHPAAALRNPTMNQVLTKDFLLIPQVLEKIKSLSGEASYHQPDSQSGQLGLF